MKREKIHSVREHQHYTHIIYRELDTEVERWQKSGKKLWTVAQLCWWQLAIHSTKKLINLWGENHHHFLPFVKS